MAPASVYFGLIGIVGMAMRLLTCFQLLLVHCVKPCEQSPTEKIRKNILIA